MKRWLVSLDTDHVKEYVFATGRLREITGASALLDRLNRQETHKLIGGGRQIVLGGGSAMVSFADKDEARKFLEAVTTLYPEQGGEATISGVCVEYDDGAEFREVYLRAGARLRREKLSGKLPAGLPSQPLWSRCQRCGRQPATGTMPGGQTLICRTCELKWQETASSGPLGRLSRYSESQSGPKLVDFAQHKELGKFGRHLGLIYADGNGIGRIFEQQLQREQDFKQMSDLLEDAMLAALYSATAPYLPAKTTDPLPFMPVIIGGDDVLVIAEAKIALDVAYRLCLAFQEEVKSRSAQAKSGGKMDFAGDSLDVSMSAGVAIAGSSHPIFALVEMAEELQKTAKGLSAQLLTGGYGQVGALDFRVVSSPTARSWEDVRESELRLPKPGNPVYLTARPYPCRAVAGLNRPSWEALAEVVLQLRDAHYPRNKLHAWRELIQMESRTAGLLELRLMRSRLSRRHQDLMDSIAGQFHLKDGFFLVDPANTAANLSPLPDLVEVFDFVR